MLFEVYGRGVELLSEPMHEVHRLWKARKPMDGYRLLRSRIKAMHQEHTTQPADWILGCDLACACSQYEVAKKLIAMGIRHHPDDAWLTMMMLWDEAVSGNLFDFKERLDKQRPQLEKDFRSELLALETLAYSSTGWRRSAAEAERKVESMKLTPIACYILARSAGYRSEWRKAAALCEQTVGMAPNWLRARAFWGDTLLSQGDTHKAEEVLQNVPADTPRYFAFEWNRVLVREAAGHRQESLQGLLQLLDDWNIRSRHQRFVARHTALSLMVEDRADEAEALLHRLRIRNFSVKAASDVTGRNYISLPLVSQSFKHCVPTVAAMVAESQGVQASPHDYAIKMSTLDGTEMWRMIDVMRSQGFRAEVIRADREAIEGLVAQGIALIGTLQGVTSSHVEVINGFDRSLNLLYIRDPMHWFGNCVAANSITKRYEESGGLIALIAPDRIGQVNVDVNWLDEIGEAYLDLSRACTTGDEKGAKRAFAKIPDDHELSLWRDSYARGVVLTPRDYEQRMKDRLLAEVQANRASHLRMLMNQIDEEHSPRVREIAVQHQATLGESFVRLVTTRCLMVENRWNEAYEELQSLCRKLPQVEELWRDSAEVLEQMGRVDDARAALERALDINPEDPGLYQVLVKLQESSLSYGEQRKEILQAAEGRKHQRGYYPSLVSLFSEGPDGLEYEHCLKRCIHFFPMNPFYYYQLADWYLYQGREELAKEWIAKGRSRMGPEDLALYRWEESPDEAKEATDVASPPKKENETPQDTVEAEITELGQECSKLESSQVLQCTALEKLLAFEKQEQMRWWQSVRFRSIVLHRILEEMMAHADRKEKLLECLRQILPLPIPMGIPEKYVLAVCDGLGQRELTREVASVLVGWIQESCPNYRRYPALFFHVAYFQEAMGLYVQAEATLDELLNLHPAYASAWYRKSQIEIQRMDYASAWDCLAKAVEIAPGLMGAHSELAKLAAYVNDPREVEYCSTLLKIFPYSKARLFDVLAAMQRHRPAEIPNLLSHVADRFSKDDRNLIEARTCLDTGNLEKASHLLHQIDRKQVLEMQYQWLAVDLAIAQQNYAQAISVLKEMASSHPDDQDIVDQLMRLLRHTDLNQAAAMAMEQIAKGSKLPVVALVAIESEVDPIGKISGIIANQKGDDRDAMVMAFHSALSGPQQMGNYVRFLEWSCKECPHLVDLREALAIRLSIRNDDDRATKIANELLSQDPENPRWIRLKGIVIQDTNPQLSVELLQKDFDLTGNIDSLTRMARGYQLMNQLDQCRKTYLRVLDVNPRETMAITNLSYKFDHCTPELFAKACDALQHGMGHDDQYFLVTAVKLAVRLGRQVPTQWIEIAMKRLAVIGSEGGFQDEDARLRAAIYAWQHAHQVAKKERVRLASFLDGWKARWIWPRTRWIPKA